MWLEILVTLLAIFAVVFAVLRVREFWTDPKPTDNTPYFEPDLAAGMLPFFTVGMAISTPILALGAWLGNEESGAPEIFGILIACTLTPTLLISWSLGSWGRPRFLLPPSMRTPESRRRFHQAVIHDVRQEPARTEYFVAWCECGWTGRDHPDEHAARVEAEAHTPNVAAELTRPVA